MRCNVVIDLGTVNTLVYTAKAGLVIDEPSVVAVGSTHGLRAVGRAADVLYGRAPEGTQIIKPLRDGVVSDLEACTLMLGGFLRRVFRHHRLSRPGALVCVPGGATDVERRALVEATEASHPHFQVTLIDELVAAALGTGVEQRGGNAVLVVDIGGGTTEIGVVVGGGKVRSRSLRVAGNEMDAAIVRAVRDHHGLAISERTAERLKVTTGLTGGGGALAVTGVDCARWGWLRTAVIEPSLVADALERPLNVVVRALIDLLGDIPADLAEEILCGGVHLAGGGASLLGVSEWISERTCCHCEIATDPLRCVVRGLACMLDPATHGRRAAA